MDNSNAIASLIVVLLSLTVFVGVFIWLAMKIRKSGGSLTTVVLGATDHFLAKEKSRAAAVILDQKADKKLDELHREEPEDGEED